MVTQNFSRISIQTLLHIAVFSCKILTLKIVHFSVSCEPEETFIFRQSDVLQASGASETGGGPDWAPGRESDIGLNFSFLSDHFGFAVKPETGPVCFCF